MSLPPLALARSPKQGAAWGRRREWEESEEEIADLVARSYSALELQRMREESGRALRLFDLAELAGYHFDGEKAARPFLSVFAGMLFNTDSAGLVGSSQAIADMLGAFGAKVSEMCVRRALEGLEKCGLVRIRPVFKRYSEDDPFVSKVEPNRALLVRETGRYFGAGPNLLRLFDELRHKAILDRDFPGCSKRPTLPDPSPDPENTYRARANLARQLLPPPQPKQKPQAPEAASPLKESAPQAPTEIENAPSALSEKAAFGEGEADDSHPLAKPAPKAPPLALVASSAPARPSPTPAPQKQPEKPWRKVWLHKNFEEQLRHYCRVNRRKVADVFAEVLSAQLGFARPANATPLPVRVSLPSPAPLGAPFALDDDSTVQTARALLRSAFRLDSSDDNPLSPADLAHRVTLLENTLDSIVVDVSPTVDVAPSPHDTARVAATRVFDARTSGRISADRADLLWARIDQGDAAAVLEEIKD